MRLFHLPEQAHSDVVPHPFQVGCFVNEEQRRSLSGVTDWLTLENAEAIIAGRYHELKPIAAEIVPSERCPFGCRTCPYAHNKSGVMMTKEIADVIVDRIVEVGSVRHAVITGLGEPLTNPAVTCHLARKLKEAKVAVTIYTNGFLLKDKTLTQLLDSAPDEIRISINTLYPQNYAVFHGTTTQAVYVTKQNLMSLLKERFKRNSALIVGVSFIVTELNRPFLEYSARELANSLSALGKNKKLLDYAIFRPALNYWKENWSTAGIQECNPDLAFKALESVKEILAPFCEVIIQKGRFEAIRKQLRADYERCYASGIWLEISASGRVFQCCEHLGDSSWEIGNLLHDSINAILYASERRMEVLRRANEDCSAGYCPTAVCKPGPYNKAISDIEQYRLDGKLDDKVIQWLYLNARLNQKAASRSQERAQTVAGEVA